MGKQSRERRERQQQRQQLLQEQTEIIRLNKATRVWDYIARDGLSLKQFYHGGAVWSPFQRVTADGIYEQEITFLKGGDDLRDYLRRNAFNVRPPFPHLFVEFWPLSPAIVPDSDSVMLFGYFLSCCHDENDSEDDIEIEVTPILASPLSWSENRLRYTRIVPSFHFSVTPLGEVSESLIKYLDDHQVPYDDMTFETWEDFYTQAIRFFPVVLKVINLMNCRNVELLENEPDYTLSKVHEHRYGVPLTKYKTLHVTPTRKESAHDDRLQEQFNIMPLHIRRGNFATYTDDAPLFGKYVGTFWRPATVVGNEKNGVVVKDYDVRPE